ncbi:sure-like protein [Westerdykella ornata]|uniref:Sure-like protein n=1 Tax=Westerdykella ornata TaxID=318751 RepID=A0A6A6JS12_WESOR|nr:sure-like protein [Westerdykella ornata]KAF2278648.1 sure-like protein [Westerdykella ornata]
MHILVTNDDGPPSNHSSPYIHSLVTTLQQAGHTVSVVLPHTQRSWIGKAHLVGHAVKPTYFRPSPLTIDPATGRFSNTGSTSPHPLPKSSSSEEWILIDSTPASCVQVGLYHYFSSRGPIDLVISGPNYGRNSTAVFALSSGTIGGAMEAAVCGKRAIALSYAFFDRNHDARIISEASALAARLVQHLYDHWDEGTHLYTVNVPLVEGVEKRKVVYTEMLQNFWRSGSCFQAVEVPVLECESAEEAEEDVRREEVEQGRLELVRSRSRERKLNGTGSGDGNETARPDGTATEEEERIREEEEDAREGAEKHIRYTHKHFHWAPQFKDVYQSVEESAPGNDGWAVAQGYTSVTPLRANFMHVHGFSGQEIKLE